MSYSLSVVMRYRLMVISGKKLGMAPCGVNDERRGLSDVQGR